ncbi:MAG TPA: restriction endonuclease subunit S [Frateuria sp.]|uniref:restriction endonuclease subunit S n=1 Tax=Frateuria sp. TaxID=2211372 RepID=UPI002DF5A9E3|nr:restriction endonuclease subunit S [Frateuria sp.]
MIEVDVPKGWTLATIVEVATASGGGTPSKSDPSYWVDGDVPWVSPKDMKVFDIDASEDTVTTKALDRLTLIPEDSVLVVVRSGILSRTLPVAVNRVPVTVNQDMRAFVPEAGVSARFLAWQLISRERDILDRCSKDGTTVASIEGPALAAYPLLLAPQGEQVRIVEKLEELLSDLDAGVAELKAAQRKLAQYRQSLLKAAVEGTLTADWRAARARSGERQETGADLLQRILTERRARWEAKQLAKYAEQGKTAPKGWQAKYPEPVAPDTDGLPMLPSGWAWASLDMVGEIASGVAKGMKRSTTAPVREVPYLRVANVQRGYLDLSQIKTIEAAEADIEELRLRPGDVLFNEGGDLDKLGRGWVWRGEVPECIHQNHVFRLRPYLPATPPELISHHGNTFGRTWFKSAGKQTTNLASINMTMLRAFPVPIAPELESAEILAMLSPMLDAVAAQEVSVELGLRQGDAQRKNILKAAFSGQLVPQDPNDEPASALLERIRAERATRDGATRPRGRKPRTTA